MARLPVTAAALAACALPLPAAALCTSDGGPRPAVVLERFLSADCLACWTDPRTPEAAPGTLALDWVLPGRQREDAPLSAVATRDAEARLRSLGRQLPRQADTVTSRRAGDEPAVRIALGEAFNDYIAASIEMPEGGGPWDAWLLLVEELPAGAEGSPVARRLVRNVFRPPWQRRAATGERLHEARSMQIHEGARPARLRLVALVQDARGRMRSITQVECRE